MTQLDLDAIMARHSENDAGFCVVDGVRWPCDPWVAAREAWDAAENEESEAKASSLLSAPGRCNEA